MPVPSPAPRPLWYTTLQRLMVLAVAACAAWAGDGLPVVGIVGQPLIVLSLQDGPATGAGQNLRTSLGTSSPRDGDSAAVVSGAGATVARSGFGQSAATFRFAVGQPAPGRYVFWARWRQGGDPNVCTQDFEVWAGADAATLEKRSSVKLRSSGWTAAWIAGGPLELKGDEAVIEVRNRGASQDAKVFEGFLLAPPQPPPALAVEGSAERPAIILGLGRSPSWPTTASDPALRVFAGATSGLLDADWITTDEAAVTVAKKGFGSWGAGFRFPITQPIPAGLYSFHARYMTGGEESQTRQTFTIKSGVDAAGLGVRGTFVTHNRVPWRQQWSSGSGSLAIFPGDALIEIVNAGRAHDAKVFTAFELRLEVPFGAWMSAEQGRKRSAFLAAAKPVEQPERSLLLIDGQGPDDVLFAGLAGAAGLQQLAVTYLAGADADAMAATLNISGRPAAVILDRDLKALGVLRSPSDPAQVARFLTDPASSPPPAHPQIATAQPAPLAGGAPLRWLVASGWPGHCGIGSFGLDAESIQRPNPGDPYVYAFYTAGQRWGRWSERPVDSRGVCRIIDRLGDDFGWGRSTSYAVAYLKVEQAVQAVLHFQHSGVESAVYLDSAAQALAVDPAQPFGIRRLTGVARVAGRAGVEIHDDVVTPEDSQPALTTTLRLSPGWHCLILKLVHRQPEGDTVFVASRLTTVDGGAITGIATTTSDPGAVLGVNLTAARLWPRLSLAGIPGNLPHPGERLDVIADLRRCHLGFPVYAGPFLPIPATLRVQMVDYDGAILTTTETKAVFPAVARLDLGVAPGPGYYALRTELLADDGRLIHRYPDGGFSVVLGNAAQRERLERKEMWNSWYYALNEDWSTTAAWLERTGVLKNVGSFPGMPADSAERWKDASARGITLVGDFAADSSWMNNSQPEAEKMLAVAPTHTRYFKTVNEIDGRCEAEWIQTRKPETWVERAKWQHTAVHQARPDAVFFGGSLYCSGKDGNQVPEGSFTPRAWFRRCLELGLDQYVDVWDVHSYPQYPPLLEGQVSNNPKESDLGVLDVFKELGRKNSKPFFYGETAALPWHGFAGMRWQASTIAKMAAWTNSRQDILGAALCAAHHDYRETMEDYAMAHTPGEAALYTASALIDGFPYRRLSSDDPAVQAAVFGTTIMAWRSDDRSGTWSQALDGPGPYVIVDVVGRVRPLPVVDGKASLTISASPVYLLSQADHLRLTRD